MLNTRPRLPICATLPITILVTGALIHGQSLADAAKKAEAQHADKAPATKSYSNNDLHAARPVTPPPSSEAAAPPASTKAASEEKGATKEGPRDETYWRARIDPLHRRIRENVVKALPLQHRVGELTDELDGIGPLNARRGGVEAERQRLITKVDELENARHADEAELARIEEEGRRAGALPGWFRPRP